MQFVQQGGSARLPVPKRRLRHVRYEGWGIALSGVFVVSAILVPSPGTPSVLRERDRVRGIWKSRIYPFRKAPSPQPSPGVPGEGEEGVRHICSHRRRRRLPPALHSRPQSSLRALVDRHARGGVNNAIRRPAFRAGSRDCSHPFRPPRPGSSGRNGRSAR